MKIGILTFHSQLNYGGVLQCWALQTALQKLGYEVVVIDRWLDKTNGFLRGIRFNSLSLKEKLKRLINLSFMLGESSCRQRRRVTEHFLAEKINLTECSFYQWDEIKSADVKFDLVVVGSDQVWNGTYNDPRPYLLIGAPMWPAISYAASFGMNELPKNLIRVYQKGFSRFAKISCREAEGVELVEHAGFKATHVVDPTILLDPDAWQSFANNSVFKEPTLVCYFLSKNFFSYLAELQCFAKTKHCKVKIFVNEGWRIPLPRNFTRITQWISYKKASICGDVEICMAAGPKEFLDAHASASWIITDSFHSLMFASIFNKNVRVIKPKDDFRRKMFARLEEFVKANIAEQAVVENLNDALAAFQKGESVTYNREKIFFERRRSLSWLKDAISSVLLSTSAR